MGRPKLSPAERDARKAARLKQDPQDLMAKIAHAQSQTPNVLPPEEDAPKMNDQVSSTISATNTGPEPGENDPDYEAKMLDKIEQAMAAARAQVLDSLKPPQIRINPLSASTSEVQIISNREPGIEDEEKDPRPEFVQADD